MPAHLLDVGLEQQLGPHRLGAAAAPAGVVADVGVAPCELLWLKKTTKLMTELHLWSWGGRGVGLPGAAGCCRSGESGSTEAFSRSDT